MPYSKTLFGSDINADSCIKFGLVESMTQSFLVFHAKLENLEYVYSMSTICLKLSEPSRSTIISPLPNPQPHLGHVWIISYYLNLMQMFCDQHVSVFSTASAICQQIFSHISWQHKEPYVSQMGTWYPLSHSPDSTFYLFFFSFLTHS